MTKWEIKFSGNTCVRDFFFRIEEESDARGVPSSYIVRRFHELLIDTALKYFRSIKHPELCYASLKAAFLKTFDVVDFDFKVERELRGLKQRGNQSVRDFIIEARDLNSKLVSPIGEDSLFLIIKYGLHPRYFPCLATNLINDLDSLLQIAGNFETFQSQPSSSKHVAPVQIQQSPP